MNCKQCKAPIEYANPPEDPCWILNKECWEERQALAALAPQLQRLWGKVIFQAAGLRTEMFDVPVNGSNPSDPHTYRDSYLGG